MTKTQLAIRNALNRAIAAAGSQAELARRASTDDKLISVQAINNALRRGAVSPDLALALERGCNGVVTKEQLVWGDQQDKAA